MLETVEGLQIAPCDGLVAQDRLGVSQRPERLTVSCLAFRVGDDGCAEAIDRGATLFRVAGDSKLVASTGPRPRRYSRYLTVHIRWPLQISSLSATSQMHEDL